MSFQRQQLSILSASVIGRIGRQGFPAAKTPAGIGRVTTLPAPITLPAPDRHAAADGYVAGNPAVILDRNGTGVFPVGHRAVRLGEHVALLPAKRVHRRQQRNVRTHEDVCPDGDGRAVETGEVEVGVAVFADRGKAAVVKLDRTLDIGVFA